MKSKRLASLALALVMTVGLSVPAFAASTKVTGTYQETKIDVDVPTTGTAQINPYALNVKLDDASSISKQQIVTMPMLIVNKSDMKIAVSATVTGEVKGDFKFATATDVLKTEKDKDGKVTAEAITTKSGRVYLQLQKADSLDDTALAADGAKAEEMIQGFDAAKVNAAVAGWSFDPADPGEKAILLSTKAASEEEIVELAPIDTETEGSTTTKVGGVAMFRLAGQVVTAPKTAWAKSDGFTATIAFTFAPPAE